MFVFTIVIFIKDIYIAIYLNMIQVTILNISFRANTKVHL